MNSVEVQTEPSSYKDPSGYIFYLRNEVYRYISPSEVPLYQKLLRSDLFAGLINNRKIVGTRLVQVSEDEHLARNFDVITETVLRHEKIDFITYPYEWSISMCGDAALLTLDIQEALLLGGYSLKDATPYNVQFIASNPIFVDFTSIEECSKTGIWMAYNQFCELWLFPMLLYQYGLPDLRSIYLDYIDGIKVDETMMVAGFRPFWRFGLVIDYLLPGVITKSDRIMAKVNHGLKLKERKNSNEIQLGTVKRLKKVIKKLTKCRPTSNWSSYAQVCSYTKAAEALKESFLRKFLERERIKTLLDIGCNTGSYSRMAAEYGIQVVAIDSDMACVEELYKDSQRNNRSILPLCADISNPSPAIGWENKERRSLLERLNLRFDCVLSLALVHHLLITKRVPLDFIVQLEHKLSRQYLMTEFVGKNDCMFKQLLRYRKESYDFYDVDYFKKKHSDHFEIIEEVNQSDCGAHMERVLFVMRKRI